MNLKQFHYFRLEKQLFRTDLFSITKTLLNKDDVTKLEIGLLLLEKVR